MQSRGKAKASQLDRLKNGGREVHCHTAFDIHTVGRQELSVSSACRAILPASWLVSAKDSFLQQLIAQLPRHLITGACANSIQ
jgi:hypothetical protein